MINLGIAAIVALTPAAMGCAGGSATTTADGTGADTAATAAAAAAVPAFNADSAYRWVARQTDMGPRTPGSDAHAATADMLVDGLRRYGADTIIEQRATVTRVDGDKMPVRNILARFNSNAPRRLLLLAHYDTRPWADEDADASVHTTPFDGANDGASGVGVLMEIARHLGTQQPQVGIDILLTDSEDSGVDAPEGADPATAQLYDLTWCVGTQHFVKEMPYGDTPRPEGAILLDMVGARDAVFPYEYFSSQAAPALMQRIWQTGARLGYGSRFPQRMGGAVNDDHVHLIGAGIPTVDIIEIGHPATGSFNPTWHTMADNIDNIDRATLGVVGNTVLTVVYEY